jgi:hypothetical protein
VWEVESGANHHIKVKFDDPIANVQRTLSEMTSKPLTSEKCTLRKSQETRNMGPHHCWKKNILEGGFITRENAVSAMQKDAYVTRLRKACSEILCSVGPQGRVLLATNLMDEHKRKRHRDDFN